MIRRVVPLNLVEGCAKTVLAGYYKYGVQTLLTGDFGTTGTIVMEIYEDEVGGCDSAGVVFPEQPDGRQGL